MINLSGHLGVLGERFEATALDFIKELATIFLEAELGC
jgi:hypothetical protein